ncbi:ABC transporter permease [Terrilactibacillus sp. S3-3]|nr:ABC transporter permease [Terrilactibacillus sp. S3-3]
MKSVIIKELKLMVKEKGNVFFLIIMPLLFIVVFGSIFNADASSMTIHVNDKDQSAASQTFIRQLNHVKGFHVKNDSTASVAAQVKSIKNGKLSSLIVIDKGFEKGLNSGRGSADIQIYKDAASSDTPESIQAVLQNMANQYREQKLAQTLTKAGNSPQQIKETLAPPIQIHPISENGSHVDFISLIVPGYTVMFVFFIMNSMVRRFFQEKDSGMIARLQSTPLGAIQYLIGMWIPSFIAVLIQCTVLLTFGLLFYHLHLGDPVAIILLVICLALCGTGLGLALSLVVRSENQGLGITQLISLGGAIVAGLWFPSDLLPHFAQIIGYFTPQYWALHGFQDVMIRGAHFWTIWKSFAVLVALGLAGLAIALLRFKPFIRSATD